MLRFMLIGLFLSGGSVNNHYLGSYQQALLAVCLAQFSSKRYRTGMQGVLRLAESSAPFANLFQNELGLSIQDMQQMCRYDSAHNSGMPEIGKRGQ